MTPVPTLDDLRTGGKRALARALALAEARGEDAAVTDLLDAAFRAARGHVIGLTGPPGVGKSTLVNALVATRRRTGETVGVVAVDPSSRLTGGALLGDRARIVTDPEDQGVFLRSLAARDRLGGLTDMALKAMVLMRVVMDHVVLESVGIGQSEADVAFACDTLVLCIQPGSGDALQFMKAGVMELPDIVAVTKADLGAPARRAKADVEGALSLAARDADAPPAAVIAISSTTGEGLDDLERAIRAHRDAAVADGRLARRRTEQGRAWLVDAIAVEHGRAGRARLSAMALPDARETPFTAIREALERLNSR